VFSGGRMKKLAIAIAAIALIGTPAFAADIAVKAPPPAPRARL
jgi:outer membrane immunogenic protein